MNRFPDSGLPPQNHSTDMVLSVAALNLRVRQLLESRIPLSWVGGEISNLTRAPSGHLYFTLKDSAAQVRCTMWRNRAQLLPFLPANGMKVEARALVTLYEARGDFQLNVEALRAAGTGSLHEAFMRLKERLAAEGLFAAERKRALPRLPRGVGIVTSPSAAALRDVLTVLGRRAPHLPLVIYPSPVQGADAPARLAQALQKAAQRAGQDHIDVILLVRGGGSSEDLWAFNDEALARTIAACPLPVVSGVGHETDFTIADFVADLRAATPSAAAELVSGGHVAAAQELGRLQRQLLRAMETRLHRLAQRTDLAALRLVHPRQRLQRASDRLEASQRNLRHSLQRRLAEARHTLAANEHRLARCRPALQPLQQRLARAPAALAAAARLQVQRRRERLERLAQRLEDLNPLAVLGRGYSITRGPDGSLLTDAALAPPGSRIQVQLAHGSLQAITTDGGD